MLETINLNLLNEFDFVDVYDKSNYGNENELFLYKIKSTIENNINDRNFNYDSFALKLDVSKSTLHRKINKLTGLTPCELIASYRIKLAMQMLTNDMYNISEIAYKVGFNDPKYFSRCFRNQSGLNPKKYRESVLSKREKPNYLDHETVFFNNAIAMIEERIKEQNYCVDQLAFDLCVSKSSLYRKIKNKTGLSPNELISSVRINYSTKLFAEFESIKEVAYAVGFNDTKYFSRFFKKEIGLTPTQYKLMLIEHGV